MLLVLISNFSQKRITVWTSMLISLTCIRQWHYRLPFHRVNGCPDTKISGSCGRERKPKRGDPTMRFHGPCNATRKRIWGMYASLVGNEMRSFLFLSSNCFCFEYLSNSVVQKRLFFFWINLTFIKKKKFKWKVKQIVKQWNPEISLNNNFLICKPKRNTL